MKVIAFYLPQFHNIPENDKWWGEGFTEWDNVKSARPLFDGHKQPVVPLNENYYNLLDDSVKIWQADIAKKYGVYGFCYYHYWFNGRKILEKPMEQMLNNKAIDMKFCICWANEPWTKAWVGNDREILIPQKYGDKKEWKEHFYYLLPFFKDDRYIKIDKMPLFIVYRPKVIPCLKEMLDCFRELAKENGFEGIRFMCATNDTNVDEGNLNLFDNIIEWQPHVVKSMVIGSASSSKGTILNRLRKLRRDAYKKIEETIGINPYFFDPISRKKREIFNRLDYDSIWEKIINMKPLSPNSIPGAFVRWDNTPRYGGKSTIICGETPKKFKDYMIKLIQKARTEYNTGMIFLYAWNEWAEGGYLEPDEENGYAFLNGLREALLETRELEEE